jgi:hypothetical protein
MRVVSTRSGTLKKNVDPRQVCLNPDAAAVHLDELLLML